MSARGQQDDLPGDQQASQEMKVVHGTHGVPRGGVAGDPQISGPTPCRALTYHSPHARAHRLWPLGTCPEHRGRSGAVRMVCVHLPWYVWAIPRNGADCEAGREANFRCETKLMVLKLYLEYN